MNLQTFTNSHFGQIRATIFDGLPVFVGVDIAKTLKYTNPRKAIRDHVDEEDRAYCQLSDIQGGNDSFTPHTKDSRLLVINESGFYSLVMRSKMPGAKQFRRWITSEVLPTIRKHGAYMTSQTIEKALTDPDTIIRLATDLKNERQQKELLKKRTELQCRVIKFNAPKVEYFDEVLQSKDTYTTTQIVKELGMGAPTLNNELRILRVQYKQNGTWVLYHKHQDKGYTKTYTYTYYDGAGNTKTNMQTVWTEKGRHFIHSFLQKRKQRQDSYFETAIKAVEANKTTIRQ